MEEHGNEWSSKYETDGGLGAFHSDEVLDPFPCGPIPDLIVVLYVPDEMMG
jgi:hypothetical protein